MYHWAPSGTFTGEGEHRTHLPVRPGGLSPTAAGSTGTPHRDGGKKKYLTDVSLGAQRHLYGGGRPPNAPPRASGEALSNGRRFNGYHGGWNARIVWRVRCGPSFSMPGHRGRTTESGGALVGLDAFDCARRPLRERGWPSCMHDLPQRPRRASGRRTRTSAGSARHQSGRCSGATSAFTVSRLPSSRTGPRETESSVRSTCSGPVTRTTGGSRSAVPVHA